MTIDEQCINLRMSKLDGDSSHIMALQQLQPQLTSHHEALSRFDAAVADNDITYSPTTPILLTNNDFKVIPILLNFFPKISPLEEPSQANRRRK